MRSRRGYFSPFPYFWFTFRETDRQRWGIGIHFWYARGNLLWLNRQPRFCELRLARCVILCHSRLGVADADLRISVYRVRESSRDHRKHGSDRFRACRMRDLRRRDDAALRKAWRDIPGLRFLLDGSQGK